MRKSQGLWVGEQWNGIKMKMKNTAHINLWDTAKVELRE